MQNGENKNMKKRISKTIISTVLIVLIVVSNINLQSEAANGTWKLSSGRWWYEYSNGSYAHSEYIDGYWLDGSGWYDSAWNGSWKSDSRGWWFQSGSWYPTAEWLKIDGEWYYFKASGYMACNEWVGNYYLKSSGAMAKNEWIGEYYVGSDGAWVQNKKKPTTEAPTTEQPTTEQPTTQVTTEEDHGERVEGNTYYGHYETKTETYTVYGYRADDGTFFEDGAACDDYCAERYIGYTTAEETRTREVKVWVWDR